MSKHSKQLRRAGLTVALGLCLAGAAHAQSVTGNIYGSGEPGSTVTVQNLGTGLSRYRATELPNGNYKVTLQKNGEVVATRDSVQVIIASGTDVSFGAGGNVQNLDRVEVTAAAVPRVDVTQIDTRTVFTAEQINKIAVGRDIASIALLAPSVVSNSAYTANGNTVPRMPITSTAIRSPIR